MTQWEISRAKDEKDSRGKEMWPFTFLPKQVSLWSSAVKVIHEGQGVGTTRLFCQKKIMPQMPQYFTACSH